MLLSVAPFKLATGCYTLGVRRTGSVSSTPPRDTFDLLRGGRGNSGHRIKPAVYTYIVASDDDTFRFSETGAAFFVDFASKHALHSNCAETVRYSGEFHPRPLGGWESFHDDIPDDATQWSWSLTITRVRIRRIARCSQLWLCCWSIIFPGKRRIVQGQRVLMIGSSFAVVALAYENPDLAKSRENCREYALKNRGVRRSELQPTLVEGEEALFHKASLSMTAP